MSIRSDLHEMLKEAVKNNDGLRKNIVRGLRAKIEQELFSKGLPRETDDDRLCLKVIASNRNAIAKALGMLERGGKGDSELALSYRFEIAFCDRLLPETRSPEETREIVRAKIAELGTRDAGLVIKKVIGEYPGEVEPSIVARAAKDLL
jgi:uncharacterized protein YqeY